LLQSAYQAAQLFVYGGIIMEAMREAWTDDRMDDLAARMDRGFAQAEARMNRFEDRIEKHFERIDVRFEKMDERFEKVDERFEKLNERFEWQWRLLLATYLTTLVGLFTAHF
jgi:phage shock protein A